MTITIIERIIILENGKEFVLYSDIDDRGELISQSFSEVLPEDTHAKTE